MQNFNIIEIAAILCVCKIKDVEFSDNVFSYNSTLNYSTNIICKKCKHYVVIRYAQNVKVQVIEWIQ